MTGYSAIDTYSSLVDEVITSLAGFGIAGEQVCSLLANVGAADVLIGIDDASAISRGIIEIDEEVVYVSANSSGNLTIPTWGRGYKGTTAAAHTGGAKVSVNPVYPRSIVSREINNTIRSMYPALFAIGATEITTDGANWQYALPSDLDRVLLVESKWTTQDGWFPVREWETVHSADTTDYASGKFLAVGCLYTAGMTLRVVYAKQPTLLSASSDLYTATGFPASSRDVVVYGTAARLLPWQDAGRVPVDTVMGDLQDQAKPLGGGVALARTLQQQYQVRLSQERQALLARYPVKSRRTR